MKPFQITLADGRSIDAGDYRRQLESRGRLVVPGIDPYNINLQDTATIASGQAFLKSELTKYDPLITLPLVDTEWAIDMPAQTDLGWADSIAKNYQDYGVKGGSGAAGAAAGSANVVSLAQQNLGMDYWYPHIWKGMLSIGMTDLMRAQITGRSLNERLMASLQINFDLHMQTVTYIGVNGYPGLLNNPSIPTVSASPITSGYGASTLWVNKTPQQILLDVNNAITRGWQQAGWDQRGCPNRGLIPHEYWAYLTQPMSIVSNGVTSSGATSIADYIMKNNIYTLRFQKPFTLGSTVYNKTAAIDGSALFVAYRRDASFVKLSYMPITNMGTAINVVDQSYDTAYQSNIGPVEFMYNGANGPIAYTSDI